MSGARRAVGVRRVCAVVMSAVTMVVLPVVVVRVGDGDAGTGS